VGCVNIFRLSVVAVRHPHRRRQQLAHLELETRQSCTHDHSQWRRTAAWYMVWLYLKKTGDSFLLHIRSADALRTSCASAGESWMQIGRGTPLMHLLDCNKAVASISSRRGLPLKTSCVTLDWFDPLDYGPQLTIYRVVHKKWTILFRCLQHVCDTHTENFSTYLQQLKH